MRRDRQIEILIAMSIGVGCLIAWSVLLRVGLAWGNEKPLRGEGLGEQIRGGLSAFAADDLGKRDSQRVGLGLERRFHFAGKLNRAVHGVGSEPGPGTARAIGGHEGRESVPGEFPALGGGGLDEAVSGCCPGIEGRVTPPDCGQEFGGSTRPPFSTGADFHGLIPHFVADRIRQLHYGGQVFAVAPVLSGGAIAFPQCNTIVIVRAAHEPHGIIVPAVTVDGVRVSVFQRADTHGFVDVRCFGAGQFRHRIAPFVDERPANPQFGAVNGFHFCPPPRLGLRPIPCPVQPYDTNLIRNCQGLFYA